MLLPNFKLLYLLLKLTKIDRVKGSEFYHYVTLVLHYNYHSGQI